MGLKQRGGLVGREDRDRSFLMSCFVHACVFTVNSSGWSAPASKVEGKTATVDQNILFFPPIPFLQPPIAHFGLAASDRLSLRD